MTSVLTISELFTIINSSTVKNFVAFSGVVEYQKLTAHCVVACIGPITAETAVSYGFDPRIVADEYTIEGLTKAMIDYFRRTDKA